MFLLFGTIALTLFGAQAGVLRICTKNVVPFSFEDSDLAPEASSPWAGFSWDYFTGSILPTVMSDNTNITGIQILDCVNNTNMIKMVANGQADMAHASLTKTSERAQLVDFSDAWFFSGLRILVRSQSDFTATMVSIIQTLGTTVGIFFSVVIVLSIGGGLLLSTTEELTPGPIQPWDIKTVYSRFMGAFTVTMAILLPGSSAVIEPLGISSKLAKSPFQGFGALLGPILTSLTTLALVLNNQSSKINSFADLGGHTVLVPAATTSQTYMRTYGAGIDTIYTSSIGEALERFTAGEGDAVIFDWPVLQAWAYEQEQKYGQETMKVVGPVFEEQQYGIALRHGENSLRTSINRAVLDSWESDEYHRLENKWFGDQSITISQQVDNANTQLLAIFFMACAVFGVCLVIWIGAQVARAAGCLSQTTIEVERQESLGKKAQDIKEIIARQDGFAATLPPASLIYANWEMTRAIADFVKAWRPVSV